MKKVKSATDIFSKRKRSEIMSKIRCCKTNPELLLKKRLKKFIYQPKTFGKPDFINYEKKEVVFVDGCFWHCCPLHSKIPKNNRTYWLRKLKKNVLRDEEVDLIYRNSGWKVKRIWEHELR